MRLWLSGFVLAGYDVSAIDLDVAFREDPVGAASAAAWPEDAPVAVGLSHDVDTDLGAAQVTALIDLEESLGVRSTLFIPADVAERNADAVESWRARGWEVGLHGATHDNRLPSLEGVELQQRMARIAAVAQRFGMRGFRAPSFWIREENIVALGATFAYDSSVPSYRPRSRISPERGAYTCRPFPVGTLWELPVGLPLDDDLLRARVADDAMPAVLMRYVEAVAERGGVAVHADHAEPHLSGNAAGRARHRAFVERLQARGAWIAPLNDIAERLGPVS